MCVGTRAEYTGMREQERGRSFRRVRKTASTAPVRKSVYDVQEHLYTNCDAPHHLAQPVDYQTVAYQPQQPQYQAQPMYQRQPYYQQAPQQQQGYAT